MKRYTRNIIAALAALVTLAAVNAYAQVLPTEGEWPATTISADETVNLTGDVTITGTITINAGKTLTINSNGAERVINIHASSSKFIYNKGGNLKIIGTESARVIIDGGADFTVTYTDGYLKGVDALTPATGYTNALYPVIRSDTNGNNLELSYVTIQNCVNMSTYYGIVFCNNKGTLQFDHCLWQKNKAVDGSAIFMNTTFDGTLSMTDCEIKECIVTDDKSSGVVRAAGGQTKSIMNIKDSRFHHNAGTKNHHAAICTMSLVGSNLTLNGCEFDHNYFAADGASVITSSNTDFTGGKTTFHDNLGEGYGAGISFYAYNSSTGNPTSPIDIVANLPGNVEIYNNKAQCGAGVYVYYYWVEYPVGSTYTLNIGGADIHNNEATDLGGGVYMYWKQKFVDGHEVTEGRDVNITMTGGKVYNNKAGKGGGIAVTAAPATLTGGKVYGNTATIDGGGIYSDGVVNVSGIELTDNTAANGGGLWVSSDLSLTGGKITGNEAENGAGVYATGDVTMSGTEISGNEATGNGGGLWNNGTMAFTAGDLVSNKAKNGAGIYVADGGVMNYNNGGKLTGNEAFQRGGGVYLASGADASHVSTLNINFTPSAGDEFSLFNNTAALVTGGAGDDIYAEAGNTKMTVPDISAMTLEGYSHSNAKLAWYEDYENNDANYADGTVANTESGYTPKRYRPNRDAYDEVYSVADIATNSAYNGKYLALTMGFEYRGINIRRKGLEPGENAIYMIVVTDDGGNVIRTQYVVVKGTEAEWDGTHLQIDGIPAGYKVNVLETTWTWYKTSNDPADIKKTETIDSGKGLVVFSFENTHADDTPLHDEDIEDNSLK